MKKKIRQSFLVLYDILAVSLSYFIAFLLRFDTELFYSESAQLFFQVVLDNLVVLIAIKLFVFYLFGMYNSLWKYASISEMLQVIKASVFATAMSMSYIIIKQLLVPRSVYIMTMVIDIILIGGLRFSYRLIRTLKNSQRNRNSKGRNVMVIGAGQAGAMVIRELLDHPESNKLPVAVIDDDPLKKHTFLMGIPVVGGRQNMTRAVLEKHVDEIIFAIPSMPKKEKKKLINIASQTSAKLMTAPSMYEIIDGRININQIREIEIKDILGRDEVDLETQVTRKYIHDNVVLVTGAGGSIGSELCRQIAAYEPKVLLMLDIYENNVYTLNLELKKEFPNLDMRIIIASVRDRKRIFELFDTMRPDVVFHAAAHKHVPLMEANPMEAIKNNVFGTKNVVEAAIESGSERFTLISTDKAVNPTNIMGASKRICELIVQANCKNGKTKLSAVRFGNVLGSNGSVIPIFKKQIAEGGPVTITHAEVIRYFMTIPEASRLVIQAASMALDGEIFILDMGDPVKIVDLAENMIKLSGLEPYEDIEIEFVGLRPGEKLYEELILDKEQALSTKYESIFIEKPTTVSKDSIYEVIDQFEQLYKIKDEKDLVGLVKQLVPTFKRNNGS